MPTSGDGILEATFDPTWAAVRLIVDGGMWPSSVDAITITRHPVGEASIPMRGVENRSVVGGTFVGSDHEMPLGSVVAYTVTGFFEGAEVASSSVSVGTDGAASGMWVKVAGQPDLTMRCPIRALSDVTSETIGGVYQVAGGGGAVAQTTAQWSGIESDRAAVSLSVEAGSERARLRAILAAARVVLLQPVGSTDLDPGWYFVRSVSRSNLAQVESFSHRLFMLDVQRTGVPAGAGSGIAGTSWAKLAGTYDTWTDVLAAFDTWFDVLKGA